jgi:hypothetical protein
VRTAFREHSALCASSALKGIAACILASASLFAQSPPVNVSVSPSSGSGTAHSFSFVASSASGYQDIAGCR